MSNFSRSNFSLRNRASVALAGFALIAGLASAQAREVNPRDFQAFGYDVRIGGDQSQWRKPTGAEILGGFYGPDDEVNDRTGETRHR
jgi:hypothetical protein